MNLDQLSSMASRRDFPTGIISLSCSYDTSAAQGEIHWHNCQSGPDDA